jgi:hypothetical protein
VDFTDESGGEVPFPFDGFAAEDVVNGKAAGEVGDGVEFPVDGVCELDDGLEDVREARAGLEMDAAIADLEGNVVAALPADEVDEAAGGIAVA